MFVNNMTSQSKNKWSVNFGIYEKTIFFSYFSLSDRVCDSRNENWLVNYTPFEDVAKMTSCL